MSSQFDGAGKPYRDPSLTAVVVLFVVLVVAVVAMWMAPAFAPEGSETPTVQRWVQPADGG